VVEYIFQTFYRLKMLPGSQRAFTLVELSVVIAIIVVFITLLLSAVQA